MEYRKAPEVEEIGRELIEEHHPHLLGVRVEFLFMSKTPKSKGRDVWGRAKKISGLNAFLALGPNVLPETYEDQPFDLFVIEISEEVWDRLRSKGRRALVDHELSHCQIVEDEEGRVNLAVVGHDVTEFEAVIRRNGLWREDLEEFVKAGAEQLELSEAGA
jgi:predicted metallopeptidase